MNDSKRPIFAITAGDPNGIGPEITIKAIIKNQDILEKTIPVIFCHPQVLHYYMTNLSIKIDIKQITNFSDLNSDKNSIFCFPVNVEYYQPEPGKLSSISGEHAFQYIKTAINIANNGRVNGVITAPINKEALRMANLPYLDHTEMFTRLTNSEHTLTLFVTGKLRIFFYSRHIPFREIADDLNVSKLVHTLHICQQHLQQIGIKNPHIAVAALNPHAGDGGMFGKEEIEIIQPAVQSAAQQNIMVSGPIPADSVFHLAREGHYDAVLSLYHDQGHIAAKTYDFYKTISITTGLPFIRTSVDHGTAMDIAGKGIANEASMVEAIKTALKYYW